MDNTFVLQIVFAVIAIAGWAGTVIAMGVTSQKPYWRGSLIVAVLATCVLCLIPPKQQLKLGIDLAGGTTLVYEVDASIYWAVIGEPFTITSDSITVQLTDADRSPGAAAPQTARFVVAGPMRLDRMDGDEQPRVIAITDPGFTRQEPQTAWRTDTSEQLRNEVGSGQDSATWTFTDLSPGEYRLSTRWTSDENRPEFAWFTIHEGDRQVAEAGMNQRMDPKFHQPVIRSYEGTAAVIEETIAVLRDRVDPNGVRNLVWRPQGSNRLEIQMAEAPPETAVRREAYYKQRDALLARNLRASDIDAAVREGRSELPGATEHELALLGQVVRAYQAFEQARKPQAERQQEYNEAKTALENATENQRAAAQATHDRLLDELIALSETLNETQTAYDAARQPLLQARIAPTELENIIAISNDELTDAGYDKALREQTATLPGEIVESIKADRAAGKPISLREIALRRLIREHPDKAADLRTVTDAYASYEEVKGPLDDPNDLIALLKGSGVLEFRIAPTPAAVAIDLESYRQQLREKGPRSGADRPYRWFIIDDPVEFAGGRQAQQSLEADAAAFFESARNMVGQEYAGNYYLLLANGATNSLSARQEGWKITSASETYDENQMPAVGFNLNTIGGNLMGNLTNTHKGQPMGILLDGRLMSAPTIEGRITDRGRITGGSGGFDRQELTYLIRTLNAGSIAGRLSDEPISINRFGPQLGQDNLQHGLKTALWALGMVAGFMAFYYMFWGLVADFALFANMVIILGIMAMLDATFTLPGIAGIVLTIGMAVDANVLIFERIREELEQKADMPTAIRLGYEKALSTIVDANITTLIICMVLYYTATAEIKGFAITLGIGILATLFTALFCTRAIINGYITVTKAKHIAMLSTVVPAIRRLLKPNINWIAKRYAFITVSLIVIVAGVMMIGRRGQDMFDIEFRGGTQVGIDLATDEQGEPRQMLSIEQVEQRLAKAASDYNLPQLAKENGAAVVTVGQTQNRDGTTVAARFSIATLSQDAPAVSEAIKAAFDDVLDVSRPIHFDGEEAARLFDAPVYPVQSSPLGESIQRPGISEDVSDYLGGVAIVLDNLEPAATVEEIDSRIRRMRFVPPYEALGYRGFQVIGLQRSVAGDTYQSVAIVSTDDNTNYNNSPETFHTDATGLAQTEWNLIKAAMADQESLSSVANFSSQVSNTMKQNAVVALVLSLLAVVIYIWVRFGSLRYSLAAIVALVHDVAIALGLVALAGLIHNSVFGQALLLSDFKINLSMVAGVLTIVGYSLNDTIVIFDRVRENRGRLATASASVINDSINQTISRTVLTSGTTLMALGTLYVFGGDGVHGFAFMMIIGVVVGTYSSVAIAAPILLFGQSTKTAAKKAS